MLIINPSAIKPIPKNVNEISFIIFSDKVKGLTLKGFKYNIENLDIKKGEARCISNVIVENEANLLIKSGSLLCVIK